MDWSITRLNKLWEKGLHFVECQNADKALSHLIRWFLKMTRQVRDIKGWKTRGRVSTRQANCTNIPRTYRFETFGSDLIDESKFFLAHLIANALL